jgi:hypothetical protein
MRLSLQNCALSAWVSRHFDQISRKIDFVNNMLFDFETKFCLDLQFKTTQWGCNSSKSKR